MKTETLSTAYDSLPNGVKPVTLALAVLVERIGSLSKPDRDDLFDLVQSWRNASTREEQAQIYHTLEEILSQGPLQLVTMPLGETKPLAPEAKSWAEHVGGRIRELRTAKSWTQAQLAELSGLTQSHISRIENAEHTATSLTLSKIADALDVNLTNLDPCATDDNEEDLPSNQ